MALMSVASLALAHGLLEEEAETAEELPILVEGHLDGLSVLVGQQLLVSVGMLLNDLIWALQKAVLIVALQVCADFSEEVLNDAASTC